MKQIKDYIVFNIDVTGLNKEHDYVNEMVALKIIDGEVVDSKHHLFGYNSMEKISKIINIFFEHYPIVVYNYNYIKTFTNLDVNNEIIDILELSRKRYSDLNNYCMSTIADFLNCNISESNNLFDNTILINEIFKKISDDILNEEILDFIKNNENITPAILQRKFIIGYKRAKRLLDNKEPDNML